MFDPGNPTDHTFGAGPNFFFKYFFSSVVFLFLSTIIEDFQMKTNDDLNWIPKYLYCASPRFREKKSIIYIYNDCLTNINLFNHNNYIFTLHFL